jgi:hypothetical protein
MLAAMRQMPDGAHPRTWVKTAACLAGKNAFPDFRGRT